MASQEFFVGDAVTASLSAWAASPSTLSRPRSIGLNLSILQPAPTALTEAYAKLLDESPAEVAALRSCGVYIYPASAFHITVASLAPFNNTGIVSAADNRALAAVWQRALAAEVGGVAGWPAAPIALVAERLVLEKSAAFILWRDAAGAVAQLRSRIQALASELLASGGGGAGAGGRVPAAAELPPAGASGAPAEADALGGDSAAEEAPASLLARAGMRMPSLAFVHTTFLRFPADIAAGSAEARDVRAAFEALAARWKPFTVYADCTRLVDECAPYMHLASIDASVLASYPF